MTLFEKVYFTALFLSFVLLLLGLDEDFWSKTSFDNYLLDRPFFIITLLTCAYIVVKLILLAFGINISLFPSLRSFP